VPQAVVVLRMEAKKPVQKVLELESGPTRQALALALALARAAEQEQEQELRELESGPGR
jgi:hypothetical protein